MGDLDNTLRLRELASSIASLQSGKYSDFTIRCSDDTIIHAHQAVVCPRSRVLSSMLDGNFQEATTKEVYLEDDEPQIVKNMVEFLYTTDYNDGQSYAEPDPVREVGCAMPIVNDEPEEFIGFHPFQTQKKASWVISNTVYNPKSLVTNARMYIIADKNEISMLKSLAMSKYQQVVSECWNNTAFSESARLIYENTIESDRALKEIIVRVASDNISTLLDRGEFTELLKSEGDLATSILKLIVASKQPTNKFEFADSYSWGSSSQSKGKNKR